MNQTVLITGASRGIGAACALEFAKRGYRVIINYNRSETEAKQVLSEILALGGIGMCVQADVSDEAQVASLFRQAESFGGVDVLVNNAGIAQTAMLCDTTPDMWRRIFSTNVDGVYLCCRAAIDRMVHKKYGKIINISSMWGITGAACESAYSASKAAVIGFTKALAKELGPSNITVNCVAPGVVDTQMNVHLDAQDLEALRLETPLLTIAKPEKIASVVCFLASEGASFITGQIMSPNGGYLI